MIAPDPPLDDLGDQELIERWKGGDQRAATALVARHAASLARLVPAVRESDIVRAGAGVRAQALRPDGSMVDDFLIETAPNQVHVLNAPSPAATCSLEIGRHIADQLD